MITSIIDPQLDRGSAESQIPVWNNTTKRFVPSTTLAGLASVTTTVLNTGVTTITAATTGAAAAPLVVKNTTAYGDPWTQYSQIWLDSAGAVMAYIRNDGTFYLAGSNGLIKPGGIQSKDGSSSNLGCYSHFLLYDNKFLRFRDNAIGIYSQADTFMDIFADGGIRVGDSSAGAPTNYALFSSTGVLSFAGSAGLRLPRHTDNVSNPPTDAELDAALGAPSAVGEGYIAIVDDNDAGANVYLVVSTGTDADKWWILTLTQAA